MHRFKPLLIVAVLALSAFLAFGCANEKKEEKKNEPAATQNGKAETPSSEDMQVGFIYVSPIGDAGYSYAHHRGEQEVAKLPGVKASYVEAVPEGVDSERVLRNMARKGYKIIFATSFGYMDSVIKVAKEFPDVVFEHCSGFKRAQNVGTYFGRMYQARYLSGIVAGAMTKSGKIGYVAAFPIPEVLRGINAFTLGARKANPKAEVRVVWTKTWYDPALEKDAAKSLLDAGCDVIAQHQDSPGPQEAAQERGVYSVGYNSDMSSFAPKSHLTAAVWNWASVYTYIINGVKNGTWKSEDIWWGMDKGVVGLAPFGPMVPQDVRDKVEAERAKIMAGHDIVFQGPIKDQEGKVVAPEGETLDDAALLGMTYFVQGVVGTAK
jgi:basic membrane protein A